MGDFNPQKLPSRRLQTLWEWKDRVLLEEYYGSFNDFRLRILLFHSTSVISNWKRAPNEFRTCIDECPGRFERGSHRAPTLFNLCSTYVPLCSVKFRCVPLCLAVFRYVPLSIAAVVIVFEYCVIEVLLTCSAGKLRLIWTGPTGSLNQFDTLGKDPLSSWITTQNH